MRTQSRFRSISLILAGAFLVAPFALLQAADEQGNQLHGRVRDFRGNALAGANVWVIGQTKSEVELKNVRTDKDGKFKVDSLPDGLYAVRISLPAYRPIVEENLRLGEGDERWLDIKLSPQTGTRALNAKLIAAEDWRWVLRTSASAKRSVLRLFPERGESAHSGRATIRAGRIPDGAHPISSSARFEYRSSNGYSASMVVLGSPSEFETSGGAAVSTHWTPDSIPYSPEFSFAAGYQYMPGPLNSTAIRTYRVGSSQQIPLPGGIELEYSLDYIRLDLGRVANEILPSAEITKRFGENTAIFFAYRSETPADETDWSQDDIGLAHQRVQRLPVLTIRDGRPFIERIRRQEAGVSWTLTSEHRIVAAAYLERVTDSALSMRGAESTGATYLPLVDSRGAYMNGGNFSTSGVQVAYFAEWLNRFKTVLTYGYGSGLVLQAPAGTDDALATQMFAERAAHTAGARVSTHLPESNTTFRVEYKWVSESALTSVGLADPKDSFIRPYLTVRIQQSVPAVLFLPEGLTLMADGQNLLNQGVQSLFLSDGTQIDLVPVFRSIRGGFAYNF